jgi:hypothetical protein
MDHDKFVDNLDSDLSWRKKEISDLYSATQKNNSTVLRKSLVLVIYAHWEGFIKNGAKLYLFHIESKKLQLKNLTENYKAISLKGVIAECFNSNEGLSLNKELDFIDKFDNKGERIFKLQSKVKLDKDKSLINTKDNLNPEIFNSICRIIGIPEKDSIKSRSNWLNEHFLGNRNTISHGSKIELDKPEEFDLSIESLYELKNIILTILSNFKEDLVEYSEYEYFLNANSEIKATYDSGSNSSLISKIMEFTTIDSH